MEYKEFERIISAKRMGRYLEACGGDTRKAMTLYRYNLHFNLLIINTCKERKLQELSFFFSPRA